MRISIACTLVPPSRSKQKSARNGRFSVYSLVRIGRSVLIGIRHVSVTRQSSPSLALRSTPARGLVCWPDNAAPFDSPRRTLERPALSSTIFVKLFVRIGRIELPTRPWQGRVLPLNHIRFRQKHSTSAHYFSRTLLVFLPQPGP